jgi:PKD repeat protein
MKTLLCFCLCALVIALGSCRKDHNAHAALTACFTIPDTIYAGDTIPFTDCSTLADTVFYSFGDGSTSTFRNPTHIYLHSGSYIVSQKASTLQGQSNTMTKTISVRAGIPASGWTYFAPGSNTDSAVFYGRGRGTFYLYCSDIGFSGIPLYGSLQQMDSFKGSFSSHLTDTWADITSNGLFLLNDSVVNFSFTSTTQTPSQNSPYSSTSTFYGNRR